MSKHTMNRDKRRRNTHRISLAVATLGWLLATAPVGAAEPDSRTGNWGEQCVQQATTANDVADPSELSLFACDRALRKTPQSRERRAAILERDELIRRTICERDPANNIAEKLFGKETADAMVATLWGGSRTLPRPG